MYFAVDVDSEDWNSHFFCGSSPFSCFEHVVGERADALAVRAARAGFLPLDVVQVAFFERALAGFCHAVGADEPEVFAVQRLQRRDRRAAAQRRDRALDRRHSADAARAELEQHAFHRGAADLVGANVVADPRLLGFGEVEDQHDGDHDDRAGEHRDKHLDQRVAALGAQRVDRTPARHRQHFVVEVTVVTWVGVFWRSRSARPCPLWRCSRRCISTCSIWRPPSENVTHSSSDFAYGA